MNPTANCRTRNSNNRHVSSHLYEVSCEDEISEPSKPIPANDNGQRHEWPARDKALQNKLMTGRDDAETAVLNGRALVKLSEIRRLIEAIEPESTSWLKHNGLGIENSGEAFGRGYGSDVTRGYGPTPEHLKTLFEDGAEPSSMGEPWNLGSPYKSMDVKSALGKTVKALREVGRLRFNQNGHLIEFKTDKGRWLKITERTNEGKGSRAQRKPLSAPVDPSIYTSASFPRKPGTGENQVDFIAGKPFAVASAANGTPYGSHNVSAAKHRKAQSSFSPYYTSENDIAAREHANEQLNLLMGRLGRKLYDAIIGAATGERFDEIGGTRDDKRASAVGVFAVGVALEILLKPSAPNAVVGNL